MAAALELRSREEEQPFCLFLEGFIQSISPFLRTDTEEKSLADIYSLILTDKLFPVQPLFDLQELLLLSNMHNDILSAPNENIVNALEYVKRSILHGRPYTPEDYNKVAMELRKYLASKGDEKIISLLRELEEQTSRAQVLEREKNSHTSIIHRQNRDIMELRESLDQKESEIQKERQIRRVIYMIMGLLSGAILWRYSGMLEAVAIGRWPEVAGRTQYLRNIMGSMGAVVFFVPAVMYIKNTLWRLESQLAAATAIIAVGLGLATILDDQTWSAWSAYVQVAMLIGTVIIYGFRIRKPTDIKKKSKRSRN
jgi:hypothetical protein